MNRPGARFCGGCGKPLVPRCAACGAESEPDAQFCDSCGAALAPRPSDGAEARKVVTIVFADLVGSTTLHERLDAESARRLMDRYYRALNRAIEAHGGALVKLLGDGVMAAFGVPRVAEDDAIRAVRAAVAMQRAAQELARDAQPLALRVGVNTGEVVVSDDQADVVGDPVNVAARLQQEAGRGDVLVGESTQRLVAELVTLAPFGTLALKGRAETVAAYRVVSLDRPAGGPAAAFVGRDDELRRLVALHDAACAAPGPRLAAILGSPGLGKSRLLAELGRRLGDRAVVLTARCDPAGGGTFAPLVDTLRTVLGIDDGASADAVRAALEGDVADDAERTRIAAGIAALVAGAPPMPEETFFVVRRLLAGLATARPVVLAIDDVQWAEPLLLDLTEHLVQWSAGVPLLVVLAARPELRDARPALTVAGPLVHEVVTLGGLDASAATRLAASVIGADALPAAVAGRVLATSEGNPLYVRELVRMLVHDGVLRREGDRWTTGIALADLEMPPTIHALLAARIERLGPEERVVLERCAVVGRHFSQAAVAHLLPAESRDHLDQLLESLRRSELIEAEPGGFAGDAALRFHHALIRDAAYRRILKGTRAELHERLADWLEARAGEGGERDETIGWHLEQAHQHLRELGPIDAASRAIGDRAARHLAAAGRRALERDELARAATLLGRALDLLDPADAARAPLALDWCEALLAAGDVGPAATAVAELDRLAGTSTRLRAWHRCFAGQLAVLTDPEALRSTADAVAHAADALAAIGDAAGEAKAHAVHANALVRLGRIGACEAALDRALAAARRARDRRRANSVLAGAPLAALWGPSPVMRASGRCLDVVRVLRIAQAAPAVEAVALRCQAVLEALRGRAAAARRMIGSSKRMVEELGVTQGVLETDLFEGLIELVEGDAGAAERSLRRAYEGLREHGLGIDAAQAAALLGRALLALDRAGEAERLSHESEALAGDDLKAGIAWRGVRAEALARRGEPHLAVELARAAVDLAATTDALLDHADARRALATALRAAGRDDDAEVEQRRAIELWSAKGATLLAPHGTAADAAGHDSALLHAGLRRRVRPNAATDSAARLDAAIAARDLDDVAAQIGDDHEVVDHPTGVTYGRDGVLSSIRLLLTGREATHRLEPLATLGDAVGLFRRTMTARDFGEDGVLGGEIAHETASVITVDAAGRRRRVEVFARDRLGDAVACLYERYVEHCPAGPARERAARTAHSVAMLVAPPSVERYRTAIAPDVVFHDHRAFGMPMGRGADVFLHGLDTLFAVSSETAIRVDDVLALGPDAILMRWTNFGTERAGGGAYERPLLMLWTVDAEGLLARFEQFDTDRQEDALARFDALATGMAASPLANAVCRSQVRLERAWRDRDWNAVVAMFAPTCRLDDRRPVVRLDLAGADFLANLQMLFATRGSAWRFEPIATRGDRLALFHVRFTGEVGAGGDFADEHLAIVELDTAGRVGIVVNVDAGATDAAYAELDARFGRGEGAAYAELLAHEDAMRRAVAALDGGALLRVLPDDFTMLSRRRLASTGARLGRAEYVESLKAMDGLGVRAELRVDHLRLTPTAMVAVSTWHGSQHGGAFESPVVAVLTHDGTRIHACELFDLDELDVALARAEAPAAAMHAARIENAATRACDRLHAAWVAHDWGSFAGLLAPRFRRIDRRKMLRLDLDRQPYLDMIHAQFDMAASRATWNALATRGERLALVRMGWAGADRVVGPSEIEFVAVVATDDGGDLETAVIFDADATDEGHAELDARYEAGEAAATPHAAMTRAFRRALAARDWDALAARLAPDLVVNDHRLLGWETLHGPAAYLGALRALVDLAPDVRLRVDHFRMTARGALYVPVWLGTHEGGGFETPSVIVAEIDDAARIRRFDQYDLTQLAEAEARFAELDVTPVAS